MELGRGLVGGLIFFRQGCVVICNVTWIIVRYVFAHVCVFV